LANIVLMWSTNPVQPPMPIGQKAYFHIPSESLFMAPKQVELLATVTPAHGQNVKGVAFDPTGKMVAIAGEDRKVRLIDPTTQRDLGLPAVHPAGVLCMAYSPGGDSFATGCRDNKVRIWD